MRASFILVVVAISVLAGVCLSHAFSSFHKDSLLSSTSLHSNPLATLHDQIKALESKDSKIQSVITRASQSVKSTKARVVSASSHPSNLSFKVSASSYSRAQIDSDLANSKVSAKAATTAISSAEQNLEKLQHEEYSLRQEIDDLLSKLERVRIITEAHVYVSDGMGGSDMEAVISRPIGGKSSVKIIKGIDASVEAVEMNVASAKAGNIDHALPSFPPKEKGSDGLGGANTASSFKEPHNDSAKVIPSKGMAVSGSSDDGLGEKIVPPHSLVNIQASPSTPNALISSKPDDGLGENIVHVASFVVPSNSESEPSTMAHGKYVDGIGGSGRRLTPRISNSEAASSTFLFKKGDGMGGQVHGAQYVGAISQAPLTGPMVAIDPANDGMGGRRAGHN
jgi:hypothetical protein